MKNFLLVLAVAFFSFQYSNAQENPFSVDVQGGIPMGDIGDFSNLYAGVNLTYMFAEVANSFYFGGRAGYNIYLGDEDVLGEDVDFITVAAVGRYDFADSLFGRLDVGYALGLAEGSDGAAFVEPRLGYSIFALDIFAFYQNIFDSDISFGAFGAGVALTF